MSMDFYIIPQRSGRHRILFEGGGRYGGKGKGIFLIGHGLISSIFLTGASAYFTIHHSSFGIFLRFDWGDHPQNPIPESTIVTKYSYQSD